MEAHLRSVFASALLLSGCGKLGGDLPDCQPSTFAQLSPSQPLDGLEVRWTSPNFDGMFTGHAVETLGQSCSADTCATAVAALDARHLGWDQPGQATGVREYLVGMLGGMVVGSAANEAEMATLLGSIDTLSEARIVGDLHGFTCRRAGQRGSSFQIVSSDLVSLCPVRQQEVLYQIDPDATVHELDRGDTDEQSSCVGRRPAGLVRSGGPMFGSAYGRYWAAAAELEAASVASFRILARELGAHRAPKGLIQRALAAGTDEIRHAHAMSRLARQWGAIPRLRRVRRMPVRSLSEIASENLREGCVVETWGALVGHHQASAARSRTVRQIMRAIAQDETRHAALSWDVQRWLESRLSEKERRRLAADRDGAVSQLRAHIGASVARDLEAALGLPSATVADRLFRRLDTRLWNRRSLDA